MEEMIEMLGLEGCLLPSDNQIEIDENKIAILKYKIDEDVRQVEVALSQCVYNFFTFI